jgi:hypothetical protein
MLKNYGDAPGQIPEKKLFSECQDAFPSETKGDGLLRKNNIRTGALQGPGSFKRKVKCQICGHLVDIQKVDHSGGSDDGNGAGGKITVTTNDIKDKDGNVIGTEYVPDQKYSKNAGCPLCFSKHSSKIKIQDIPSVETKNTPKL